MAHGYARPDLGPLTSSDFSGGEPVKTKLERLGFRVDHTGDDQNSPWTAPREAVDEKPASLRRDDETDFASFHISFPNGRQDDESILADSRTPVSASGLREPDSPGKAAADMKPEATVTRTAGTQSGTSFPSVEEYAAQAFFFKVSLQHSYKDGFPVSPFCVYCKRKRRVGLLYKIYQKKTIFFSVQRPCSCGVLSLTSICLTFENIDMGAYYNFFCKFRKKKGGSNQVFLQ